MFIPSFKQTVGTTVCSLRRSSDPESIPFLLIPPSTDMNMIPMAFHLALSFFYFQDP
ncbi:hypothetical protein L873DRAFT_778366 [Choiromyces venosus 120613-1]|uniref:Uncharacterized protein n=1 Tax=Choiromyces venosus 120613-1 TaxID=1336337 RepID=A0A3N4JQG4_9PEZI|nr:hypothetical protein L873DRAFT_778366 [Choiromyces venosus 120613-1]